MSELNEDQKKFVLYTRLVHDCSRKLPNTHDSVDCFNLIKN